MSSTRTDAFHAVASTGLQYITVDLFSLGSACPEQMSPRCVHIAELADVRTDIAVRYSMRMSVIDIGNGSVLLNCSVELLTNRLWVFIWTLLLHSHVGQQIYKVNEASRQSVAHHASLHV